jgi:hypothetical protein
MSHFIPSTTINDIPADLLAPPDAPRGYETVWAFLARTETATLELMQDPVCGLIGDERRARKIARAMRVPVMLLPAPDVLHREGLTDIGAYPLAVLERVFPVSP